MHEIFTCIPEVCIQNLFDCPQFQEPSIDRDFWVRCFLTDRSNPIIHCRRFHDGRCLANGLQWKYDPPYQEES